MARTVTLEGSIKMKNKPLSKAEMDKLRKKMEAKKQKKGK